MSICAFAGLRFRERFTCLQISTSGWPVEIYLLTDRSTGQEFLISSKATIYPLGYNTNEYNKVSVEAENGNNRQNINTITNISMIMTNELPFNDKIKLHQQNLSHYLLANDTSYRDDKWNWVEQ